MYMIYLSHFNLLNSKSFKLVKTKPLAFLVDDSIIVRATSTRLSSNARENRAPLGPAQAFASNCDDYYV